MSVGADYRPKHLPDDRIRHSWQTQLHGTASHHRQLPRDAQLPSQLTDVAPALPRLQLTLYHLPDIRYQSASFAFSSVTNWPHSTAQAWRPTCRLAILSSVLSTILPVSTRCRTPICSRLNVPHIDGNMFSNTLRLMYDVTGIVHHPSTKLVSNLRDKIHYVTHNCCLQFYLAHGLQLVKIHHVLAFSQCAYMLPVIKFCIDCQKNAQSNFESSLYKLIANAFYGKTSKMYASMPTSVSLPIHRSLYAASQKHPTSIHR